MQWLSTEALLVSIESFGDDYPVIVLQVLFDADILEKPSFAKQLHHSRALGITDFEHQHGIWFKEFLDLGADFTIDVKAVNSAPQCCRRLVLFYRGLECFIFAACYIGGVTDY